MTQLGHVQRGGTPNAADRIIATRFGNAAVDLVLGERWGRMVALQGGDIVDVALADAAKGRPVPEELSRVAEIFVV